MTGGTAISHGGDLDQARRLFPDAPGPWIELSTGINPWPWSGPDGLANLELPPEVWTRLPAASAENALREAVAAYLGVGDSAAIIAAPGTQTLIQWLPRLRPIGRVAVVGPTYAEHARAWAGMGHRTSTVPDMASAVESGAEVVVVVNPNNPDGRIVDAETLSWAADRLVGRGGWLVVDEAFADTHPELSVAAHAPTTPGLIVLLSFGKFFGLAGVRLGLAVAAPPLAAVIARALGPWAVSGAALEIGARAYADETWIESTRARLAREAAALDETLATAGLPVVGGTTLFRLVEHESAGAVFERLARAGIWTRPFADHPRRLRFGLPPDDGARIRLAEALTR